MKNLQSGLDQLGIDLNIALKVLLFAVVSGLIGGFLSVISDDLSALLGGVVVGLNGLTYAFFSEKDDLAGLIVSVVAGLFSLLFWYIMASIVGDTYPVGFWKMILMGPLLGALSFGWIALLRNLPENIFPSR